MAGINKGLDEYAAQINAVDRRNFEALKQDRGKYYDHHASLVALSNQGRMFPAIDMLGGPMAADEVGQVVPQLDKMVAWNDADAARQRAESRAAYVSARTIVTTLLATAILLGGLAGWFINRMITTALSQVSERLQSLSSKCIANLGTAVGALAQGDLTETRQAPALWISEAPMSWE